MNGRCKRCLAALVSVWLVLSGFAFSPRTEATDIPHDKSVPLKVGFVENYGIFTNSVSGNIMGYGIDYMMEIAKYTGWEYEFVQVEWQQGLEMLASGELDIFGPLQKSDQREEVFDFPEREMGYEYGALYISQNNRSIFYNDISTFNKLRVATAEGNFYRERMNKFCEANDITVEYIVTECSNFASLLEDGSIDAFIAGSLFDIPNTTVVSKLSSEPYYYAVTKGKADIKDGFDMALEQIYINDCYFSAKLDQKYHGDKSINLPAFTREEVRQIENNPPLRVACDPSWAPIVYYDKQSGKFKGISVDVFEQITRTSGQTFEFLPTESFEQSKNMIDDGTADLLLGYNDNEERLGVTYSDTILEIPVIIVGNVNADFTKNLTIAMPTLYSTGALQLMREFPNFEYIDCKDSNGAVSTFFSGSTDLAFINTYVFDEIGRKRSTQDFVTIPTKIKIELAIGVSDNLDPIVLGVLNKSINRISGEQISSIVFSNTVNRAYSVPFSKIFKDNSVVIMSFLVALFTAILLLAVINQRRLSRIAYLDSLTGVSNLAKFRMDATALLKNAVPNEYVLIALDIDDFKYINDSFGYEIGNQVLLSIATYFNCCLLPRELIGRISADNFVFLGKAAAGSEPDKRIAVINDVKDELKGVLPEHYNVTFSVGLYLIENPNEDFSIIMDKTNFARKSVKGHTTDFFAEYTFEMNEEIEWKKEVTIYMEFALLHNEFETYLQPKYLLDSETLIGAEALSRWHHPQKGMLAPCSFIPIFEQNGFIKKLDLYVFEQVCALLGKWLKDGLEVSPLTISVNMSRLHFENPNLVSDLVGITRKYDVPPKLIEIELTESIVFHDAALLIDVMHALRFEGFQISIDDFGSGYSSLNMLKDLPVDVLKIDKAFLEESSDVSNGRVIIDFVTQVARRLNLITVAEGVETREQAQMLLEMGCDIAQGYYYGRPMPMSQFEQLFFKAFAKRKP